MKYLLFSGSLRTESLNKKLVTVAHHSLLQQTNNEANLIDLRTLDIPVYDGDVEALGMPKGVEHLGSLISQANAIIISTPEYNGSIAGPLKNIIDWVSRLRPVPFSEKPILLLGASPGSFGAIRSLSATRVPLEALGSFVYPQTFALPKAHEAFTSIGEISDVNQQNRLTELLQKFSNFSSKFN